jgi:predicted RNA-binding protein YlqC (UPF0109 family)
MADDHDRQFVEYIIKSIVTKPEAVSVDRTVDELGVLLTVKVAPEDMGLLIGRSGSTAKAVRTLARIVGMRANARVNVRIEEPEGGRMEKEGSGLMGDKEGTSKDVQDILGDLQ